MKCRNCKNNTLLDDGKQFSWCEIRKDNLGIDEERYCEAFSQATNADRIRAMTDEDIAMLLQPGCPPRLQCPDKPPHDCYKCWLDWLKQESRV